MKKFVALLLALVMVFALSACGSSTSSSAAVSEASGDSEGKVIFTQGFDLDYPPYSYRDDTGAIGGFDVELCQAVCDYLGWEYASDPFNWDVKDAELQSGAADCIWSGFTKNGREDDYLWSITYSNNTQMILTAKDSGIETLDDLAGKAVGVQTATSAYDMLQDDKADLAATFSSLEVYETYTIAFNDLKAGAIDAIAIDVTAGSYLIADEPDYVFLDETLGSEEYAIGFRKGDEELCEQVNAALLALVENGTYDEIGQKYPDIYEYLCLGK
jgi:polar amino acid transport system substrate-binding protein